MCAIKSVTGSSYNLLHSIFNGGNRVLCHGTGKLGTSPITHISSRRNTGDVNGSTAAPHSVIGGTSIGTIVVVLYRYITRELEERNMGNGAIAVCIHSGSLGDFAHRKRLTTYDGISTRVLSRTVTLFIRGCS